MAKIVNVLENLVFEANPGGINKYYHLYEGFIPLTSVVEAKQKQDRHNY